MKKLLVLLLFALPCYAQNSPSAAGNLTAAGTNCLTTNACLQLTLPQNTTGVAVTLSGTWSATIKPEQSGDSGTTWVTAGADLTGNGTTTYSVTALTNFRIRVSAFTSGTIVGTITSGATISAAGTINGVTVSGTPTVGQVPTAVTSTTATWQAGGGGGSGTVTSVIGTSPIVSDGSTTTPALSCATCGVTGTGLGQFASTTSAQLATVLSNETGSGLVVFGTSPTLVTPALGTPSALVLTNASGLPSTALPLPTASTMGGVFSKAAVANNFLTSISSVDGSVTSAQPALANLSDAATIALLASPTFTGTPAAPTAAVNTNTTQVATTAFVLGQRMLFTSTGSGTGTPAGTQFAFINGSATAANLLQASETNILTVMAKAGTVSALYVNLSAAEGAAATLAVTVRKTSADTTVTCTVGNLGTTCNDTAHSFTFVAGDLLSIKTIQSGTGTAQQISFGVAYF